MSHAYPPELARYVASHWPGSERLPAYSQLTELLSCCYQASLLTEELEGVTFRLVLTEPQTTGHGPPWGHHWLPFTQPRPLQPNVVAKLSPALDPRRTLLGVRLGEDGFEIWGIINAGRRGVSSRRRPVEPLGDVLTVLVDGPGSLSVYCGLQLLTHFKRGKVLPPGPDVLSSVWLEEMFHNARLDLDEKPFGSVPVDTNILRRLAQSSFRRALELLRQSGHGGTLLIAPTSEAGVFDSTNPYLNLQQRLEMGEGRCLFRALLERTVAHLGEIFAGASWVTWSDYQSCSDPLLSEIDEAFQEYSHMLAGLLAVDGAVLINQRQELLAFGAEIAGNLPPVLEVEMALDIEAARTLTESTSNVGTRHRSVYRLCSQLPWMLALVMSQDGRIRVVKQHRGRVTYWDQFSLGTDT